MTESHDNESIEDVRAYFEAQGINPDDVVKRMRKRLSKTLRNAKSRMASATKDRKYANIRVGREVNVSSTSHYTFHVKIDGFGYVKYDPSCGYYESDKDQFPRMNRFPKYVRAEVDRQVVIRLRADDTLYYEYDREGQRRFSDLRYHDAEHVKQWADRIEASRFK